MGGFGSWDLGTRLAERWAAVAPICGGGDELYADRLVGRAGVGLAWRRRRRGAGRSFATA